LLRLQPGGHLFRERPQTWQQLIGRAQVMRESGFGGDALSLSMRLMLRSSSPRASLARCRPMLP
jgi:hypothetical protein